MGNLKNLRKEAGLTQNELAAKANVTPRAIQKWERKGTAKAWAGHLKRVADILGCTVDDLL